MLANVSVQLATVSVATNNMVEIKGANELLLSAQPRYEKASVHREK